MKKVMMLIFTIILVCGCSNNSMGNSYLEPNETSDEDKLEILRGQVFGYKKIMINEKKLIENKVKKYDAYLVTFRDGKEVDRENILGIGLNAKQISDDSKIYYDISDCVNDEKSTCKIKIRQRSNHNNSKGSFLKTEGGYSLSSIDITIKNVRKGTNGMTTINQDNTKFEDVKLNEKIIVTGEMYFYENSKKVGIQSDNLTFDEIKESCDTAYVIYMVFSDKI